MVGVVIREEQHYIRNDRRLIRVLRPSGPTEVPSATSYADPLVLSIRDGGIRGPGVITKEE